ncbi:MAG: RidA family protein [Bacteroidetes bacterium]|uniref:RidA family protein n=1 Tax=Phnomibacter sp. TaxID=2836217 RepID=UPI002FDE2154|nr:RidA family protein [Bacteroidota bacterium]
MSERINYRSGAVWEDLVGYSRAVKVGNCIEIAGTTAFVNGELVGKNDLYLQCKCIFEKIEQVLLQAGSSLTDVVRTRTFVTDISRWEEFAKAHAEYFANIRPAASLIEVKGFIDPEMLVEIEVTAIISGAKV